MGAAVMAIPAGALGNAFSEVVEKEMNDEAYRGSKIDLQDHASRQTVYELVKMSSSQEEEVEDDAEAQKDQKRKPKPKAWIECSG